jgi:hypothetical protein
MAFLISLAILASLAAWGCGCNWACGVREKQSGSSVPARNEQTPEDMEGRAAA